MMTSFTSNQSSSTDNNEDTRNSTKKRYPRQRKKSDEQEQQGNEVAYRLVGTPIHIIGSGGSLYAEDERIKTRHDLDPSHFVMEFIPQEKDASVNSRNYKVNQSNQRLVAFRLKDTNLYLMQNPYGNAAHAETLNSISSLPILPEMSREIVDYVVGPENEPSGEGEGFNYDSMKLEEGPPGLLQQFTLEGRGLRKIGVKSVYGKFWRAPVWSNAVSQSPQQFGDEDFQFCRVPGTPKTTEKASGKDSVVSWQRNK